MKIARVMNGIGIDEMVNTLIPPDDVDIESYSDMLKGFLASPQRDELFILQAWDGDKLVAYLIAFASGRDVSLHQFYEDDPPRDVLSSMFAMLTEWGINGGLRGIVCENIHGCEKILPSGLFQPVSSTFRMDFVPHNTKGGEDNGKAQTFDAEPAQVNPARSNRHDTNGKVHPRGSDDDLEQHVDSSKAGDG